MPAVAAPGSSSLTVAFGRPLTALQTQGAARGLALHIPLLAGSDDEEVIGGAGAISGRDGFVLQSQGDLLAGCATFDVSDETRLTEISQRLYQNLFAVTQGYRLFRVWNYVPRINAHAAGLENYRAFCAGRSHAFEGAFGHGFTQSLPSASAVGSSDGHLSLAFVAGKAEPRHVENPEQWPAYRYPPEHGPRPPSFARATVATANERVFTFISGTAAIKGHSSLASARLDDQLACTLDNLRLISRAAGGGDRLGAEEKTARSFKVYLRHPEDLAAAKAYLEKHLLLASDHVCYLQADICRAELNVEIEARWVK